MSFHRGQQERVGMASRHESASGSTEPPEGVTTSPELTHEVHKSPDVPMGRYASRGDGELPARPAARRRSIEGTMVPATVVAPRIRRRGGISSADVDYRETSAASPGSFSNVKGAERLETLTSRLIDRPLRPLSGRLYNESRSSSTCCVNTASLGRIPA